jgi:hypothetical protein
MQVGRLLKVSSKAELQKAEAAAKDDGYLLMDASDWKVSIVMMFEQAVHSVGMLCMAELASSASASRLSHRKSSH